MFSPGLNKHGLYTIEEFKEFNEMHNELIDLFNEFIDLSTEKAKFASEWKSKEVYLNV